MAEGPERPGSGARGQVIAVFSPRGGAGKTTLALALALRAAGGRSDRVALLDLDLLFDDAGLLLGINGHTSLAKLPAPTAEQLDRPTLNECLARTAEGPNVLVGADAPEEGERLTASHVRAALASLKQQFKVVIVDCGTGFGEPVLAALEGAERIVVICTPEMTTLRDARECQRVFSQVLHIGRDRPYYVLNHPKPVHGLSREQFETALEQPMAVEVPYGGDDLGGAMVDPPRLAAALRGRDAFGQAIDRQLNELIDREPELVSGAGSSARQARGGRFMGIFNARGR
jgi:pilus assembly protein CpaE